MNPDDFEQRLSSQRLRKVPTEWREEILVAADVNRRTTAPLPVSEDQAALLVGWRLWLARFPVAWGAVATVWLVIFGVNMLMSGPAITGIARSSAPAPTDAMTMWDLQRPDSKLLASLLAEWPDNTPATASPGALPQPRSDRRRDDGMGAIRVETRFETLV